MPGLQAQIDSNQPQLIAGGIVVAPNLLTVFSLAQGGGGNDCSNSFPTTKGFSFNSLLANPRAWRERVFYKQK